MQILELVYQYLPPKKFPGIMIGIMLNLQINLGRIDILTILTLQIHEHGIALHLSRSYLIILSNVWQFLVYRFGTFC